MIIFINSIANGRRVLVGIRGEGSDELTPAAYAALQSLGLEASVKLDLEDGFAMIGKQMIFIIIFGILEMEFWIQVGIKLQIRFLIFILKIMILYQP